MAALMKKVQGGYKPPFDADAQEQELLADCIRMGYLIGRTTAKSAKGEEYELRTMDGKMHAELTNHAVTPKGLAFLDQVLKDNVAQNEQQGYADMKKALNVIAKIGAFIVAVVTVLAGLVTIFGRDAVFQFFATIVSFFQPFFQQPRQLM